MKRTHARLQVIVPRYLRRSKRGRIHDVRQHLRRHRLGADVSIFTRDPRLVFYRDEVAGTNAYVNHTHQPRKIYVVTDPPYGQLEDTLAHETLHQVVHREEGLVSASDMDRSAVLKGFNLTRLRKGLDAVPNFGGGALTHDEAQAILEAYRKRLPINNADVVVRIAEKERARRERLLERVMRDPEAARLYDLRRRSTP